MTRVALFGDPGEKKGLEPSPLIFGGSALSGFQFTEPSAVASGADASPSPAPRSTVPTWTPSTAPDTDGGNDAPWAAVLSVSPIPIYRSRSPSGRARTVSSTGSPFPPSASVGQSRRPTIAPDTPIPSIDDRDSTPPRWPGSSVSQGKRPAIDPDTPIPSVDSRAGTPARWPGLDRSRSNTPSIFLSPAPSGQSRAPATPVSGGRPREQRSPSVASGRGGFTSGRSETPLGVATLVAAIDDVANGTDETRRDVIGPFGIPSPQPLLDRAQIPQSPSSPGLRRHDVREEELPQHKFHSPEVQKALIDVKGVMGSLAGVLGSRGLFAKPAPTLQGYTEEARRLAGFEIQATRMVGLLGVTGVGKSKLLNSLLDLEAMARTSDLGNACTCVATEYHYRKEDGFAIALEVFSLDEMKTQITSLLRDYRLCYREAETSDESQNELEKKADVAESTFKALFRDNPPSKELLCQDSVEEVMRTLHGWLAGLYPTGVDETPRQFSTETECSAELARLTSQMDAAEDASGRHIAWPFIRQVKVFLKAHVLSNGLVLADLPGLHDVNAGRIAVTERHLERCNEIFAVAKVARVVTDSSVASVFKYAKKHNLSNVGIVCTYSDVVHAEEAQKAWTGKAAESLHKLIEEDLLQRRKLKAADVEWETFSKENPNGDDRELSHNYRHIKSKQKASELKLTTFLVETRRDLVRSQLKKKYSTDGLGSAIEVFCVGNDWYKMWRDEVGEEAIGWLNLSGIISLRRHCLGLTADSQLSSLAVLITADIPTLLGRLELWVKSGAETADAEQKQAAIRALDKSETRLREAFQGDGSPIKLLEVSMDDIFNEQVYQVCQTESWSRAAIEASKSWRILYVTTYGAFCRKLGVHKYETGGDMVPGDWNEQVMKQATEDVEEIWEPFVSALVAYLDTAIEKIEVALPDATRDPTLHGALVGIDRWRGLQESVGGHKKKLGQEVKKLRAKFISRLKTLRTLAFTGIPGSIIVKLLTPTYKACGVDGGIRVHERRKRLIEEAVADPQLFTSLMDRVEDRFQTLTEELQRNVDGAVGSLVEGICQTMDLIRRDNAALESEWDPAFRGRVDRQVAEARREVEKFQTLF